jgi:hypothetical protein
MKMVSEIAQLCAYNSDQCQGNKICYFSDARRRSRTSGMDHFNTGVSGLALKTGLVVDVVLITFKFPLQY